MSLQVVCGYGSQDPLPFRAIKEGELYFQEDREINLVELALATNLPKGCAETAVRGVCHPAGGAGCVWLLHPPGFSLQALSLGLWAAYF